MEDDSLIDDILNTSLSATQWNFDNLVSVFLGDTLNTLKNFGVLDKNAYDAWVEEERTNFNAIADFFFREYQRRREIVSRGKNLGHEFGEFRLPEYRNYNFDPSAVVQIAVSKFLHNIAERGASVGGGVSVARKGTRYKTIPFALRINEETVLRDVADTYLPILMKFNWELVSIGEQMTLDILPLMVFEEYGKQAEDERERAKKKTAGKHVQGRRREPFKDPYRSRGARSRGAGSPLWSSIPQTGAVREVAKWVNEDQQIEDAVKAAKNNPEFEFNLETTVNAKIAELKSNGTRQSETGRRILTACIIEAMRFVWKDRQLFTKRGKEYLTGDDAPDRYGRASEAILETLFPLYYLSCCSLIMRLSRRPYVDVAYSYKEGGVGEDKVRITRFAARGFTPEQEAGARRLAEDLYSSNNVDLEYRSVPIPMGFTLTGYSQNSNTKRLIREIIREGQRFAIELPESVTFEPTLIESRQADEDIKRRFLSAILSMLNSTIEAFNAARAQFNRDFVADYFPSPEEYLGIPLYPNPILILSELDYDVVKYPPFAVETFTIDNPNVIVRIPVYEMILADVANETRESAIAVIPQQVEGRRSTVATPTWSPPPTPPPTSPIPFERGEIPSIFGPNEYNEILSDMGLYLDGYSESSPPPVTEVTIERYGENAEEYLPLLPGQLVFSPETSQIGMPSYFTLDEFDSFLRENIFRNTDSELRNEIENDPQIQPSSTPLEPEEGPAPPITPPGEGEEEPTPEQMERIRELESQVALLEEQRKLLKKDETRYKVIDEVSRLMVRKEGLKAREHAMRRFMTSSLDTLVELRLRYSESERPFVLTASDAEGVDNAIVLDEIMNTNLRGSKSSAIAQIKTGDAARPTYRKKEGFVLPVELSGNKAPSPEEGRSDASLPSPESSKPAKKSINAKSKMTRPASNNRYCRSYVSVARGPRKRTPMVRPKASASKATRATRATSMANKTKGAKATKATKGAKATKAPVRRVPMRRRRQVGKRPVVSKKISDASENADSAVEATTETATTIVATPGPSILDTQCMETVGAAHHFVDSYARTTRQHDSLANRVDAHHLETPIESQYEEYYDDDYADEEEEDGEYAYEEEDAYDAGEPVSSHQEQEAVSGAPINAVEERASEACPSGEEATLIPVSSGEEYVDEQVVVKEPQELRASQKPSKASSSGWSMGGDDSTDPWDAEYEEDGYEEDAYADAYAGYSNGDDPYSYGIPKGAQRYYAHTGDGHSFVKDDRYMENVNPALSMLVAGALTIASKNVKGHMLESRKMCSKTVSPSTTSSHDDTGRSATPYVSTLSTPNRFNDSWQKIQRGSEEDLEAVYDNIFSHWTLLKPLCTKNAMEAYVRTLAFGLEQGNIVVAKAAMTKLCRSVHLSDSSVNAMKQLVEQMHRAVVGYRCSQCKNSKRFKECVVHANEMIVTTTSCGGL
jgi:hypothetical protein